MRTSKPFSTISYNSTVFLSVKLSDLVQRHKIAFFAFVEHFPEDDEKKSHKHVYIEPSRLIDTDQVFDFLVELDATHPDMPLRCMPPHSSRFGDWYRYALHDPQYLLSHGQQARKYHYTRDDVVSSDSDYLLELIHTIDYTADMRSQRFFEAVENGDSFASIVLCGGVPLSQIFAYERAYALLRGRITFRGDRSPHEPEDVDETVDVEVGKLLFPSNSSDQGR